MEAKIPKSTYTQYQLAIADNGHRSNLEVTEVEILLRGYMLCCCSFNNCMCVEAIHLYYTGF